MFGKKKKNKNKIEISVPSNFEHRIHTGFDPVQNGFVGLPYQWASVVETAHSQRPKPLVDHAVKSAA